MLSLKKNFYCAPCNLVNNDKIVCFINFVGNYHVGYYIRFFNHCIIQSAVPIISPDFYMYLTVKNLKIENIEVAVISQN